MIKLGVTITLLLAASGLRGQTATFVATPTIPLAGRLVFDSHRSVTVVFERRTGRIWHWNGTEFELQLGVFHDVEGGCTFDPLHNVIHTDSGGMWNGANWSYTALPIGWYLGSMAFDEPRQRLVSVIGTGVAEWDGMQWTSITPPASPGGGGGSLAYDPTRGQCVLSIGDPVTLWTWDGSQWTLLDNSGPSLGAAASYRLWFDPGTNRLILHGGGWNPVAGTWAFDASGWTSIQTPASFSRSAELAWDGIGLLRLGSYEYLPEGAFRLVGNAWQPLGIEHPSRRTDPAIASAPGQPDILVFGGDGGNGVMLDDTWSFDGDWHRRQPTGSPSPRERAGIAWSPANQAFLLHGGLDAQGTPLSDTWLWNGTNWVQQTPATIPTGRLNLVTDPAGGVLGLLPYAPATTTRQWQWDGTDWSSTPGHGSPYGFAFVIPGYDPLRSVVTAVVGWELWEWDGASWTNAGVVPFSTSLLWSAVYRPDTQRMLFNGTQPYEWDGTTWTSVNFGWGTTLRALAADYTRQRLFSFQHNHTGSTSWNGWNGVAATLTDTPATAERFGYGCALGPSPGLLTTGRPMPGNGNFGIEATALAPNTACMLALGYSTQPQHLGAGCVSWIAPPLAVHLLLTDAGGSAHAGIPIPNDYSLRGVTFLAQAAVVDPGRGLFAGLTFSDALRITIGD